MLDPLSLSSSVAGLLSLAVEITKASYEYISGVKDAPKSALALISEVTSLENVLRDLRNRIVLDTDVASSLQSAQFNSTTREQILQQCEADLKTFLEELSGKSVSLSGSAFATGFHRLKWPFKEDDMRKKIERLRWHQSQLTKLATHDTMAIASLTRKEIKDWRNNEEFRTVLEWLSPLDFEVRQRDVFSKRHPGTCQWILDSEVFKQWVEEVPDTPHKKMLWCVGSPGVGKTVASSIVIAHLIEEAKTQGYGVAYAYCSYGDALKQNPRRLLGGLLKQLAKQYPIFPDFLGTVPESRRNMPPTIDECLELLKQMSSMLPKVFLVIDALDEVDDNPQKYRAELLNIILTTIQRSDNVRMLVTSRPHLRDVTSAFSEARRLDIAASDDDVEAFLQDRIAANEDLQEILDDDEVFRDKIITSILAKSDGQFLLPALHVERLSDVTCKEDIEKVLADLASSIVETYRKTLDRLKEKPKARQDLVHSTLLWLSHVKRPLKFEELQEAVATNWQEAEFDRRRIVPRKIILEACLGLVVFESQSETIRLVHFTLGEYVKAHRQIKMDPEAFIGLSLLTYISRSSIMDSIQGRYVEFPEYLVKQYPLFPYAFHFWHSHARASQDLFEANILSYFAMRPKMLPIPQDGLQRSMRTSLLQKTPPVPSIWEDLFYAVVLHLDHIVRRLVQRGANPLAYYEDLGCPSILTWICFQYIDTIQSKDRLTEVISGVVQAMLQDHITLEKADWRDRTHMAVIFPLLTPEVMLLVLQRGLQPNEILIIPRPLELLQLIPGYHARLGVLHLAAFYKSPTAVKLLLEHGAYPHAKAPPDSPKGLTALDVALDSQAFAGDGQLLATVAALLAGGADHTICHRNPLKIARDKKYDDVAELLIAHGVVENPTEEVVMQDAESVSDGGATGTADAPEPIDTDVCQAPAADADKGGLARRRAKSHVRRMQYESTSSKMRQDSFRKSSTDALSKIVIERVEEEGDG